MQCCSGEREGGWGRERGREGENIKFKLQSSRTWLKTHWEKEMQLDLAKFAKHQMLPQLAQDVRNVK